MFKKIDDYLLRNYPSIWITRMHSFLPLGLLIALSLFFITITVGWNPKEDFPESGIAVILMIIPVLVYLVYWFIFQSRYNVVKSGGEMSIKNELTNFFIYLLVFFVAFLIIIAIPFANEVRVMNAVNIEMLKEDIKKLDKGNGLVNANYIVTQSADGKINYINQNRDKH